MKTYEIKHLETGKVLQTVEADGFTVDENGVVVFFTGTITGPHGGGRTIVAVTQISPSTLIDEKRTPKPAIVRSIEDGK